MTDRLLIAFIWVALITFENNRWNKQFVNGEVVGWTNENAKWESVKNGDLPAHVRPAGEERAKDGSLSATYIARARVPKFATGMFPGYYSAAEQKFIMTGVKDGPYYGEGEFEVLTSKPRWERVTDAKIPVRIMPVGYYMCGKDGAPEPVYTCRGHLNEKGSRLGVLWWGDNYCRVRDNEEETGSYVYDVLVA